MLLPPTDAAAVMCIASAETFGGEADAALGEVGGPRRVADDGGDLAGRDGLQQLLDDETAEVAGGSGDDDERSVLGWRGGHDPHPRHRTPKLAW